MTEDRTPYEGALARGDLWFDRSKETHDFGKKPECSTENRRLLYLVATIEALCGEVAYLTAAVQGYRSTDDAAIERQAQAGEE